MAEPISAGCKGSKVAEKRLFRAVWALFCRSAVDGCGVGLEILCGAEVEA